MTSDKRKEQIKIMKRGSVPSVRPTVKRINKVKVLSSILFPSSFLYLLSTPTTSTWTHNILTRRARKRTAAPTTSRTALHSPCLPTRLGPTRLYRKLSQRQEGQSELPASESSAPLLQPLPTFLQRCMKKLYLLPFLTNLPTNSLEIKYEMG